MYQIFDQYDKFLEDSAIEEIVKYLPQHFEEINAGSHLCELIKLKDNLYEVTHVELSDLYHKGGVYDFYNTGEQRINDLVHCLSYAVIKLDEILKSCKSEFVTEVLERTNFSFSITDSKLKDNIGKIKKESEAALFLLKPCNYNKEEFSLDELQLVYIHGINLYLRYMKSKMMEMELDLKQESLMIYPEPRPHKKKESKAKKDQLGFILMILMRDILGKRKGLKPAGEFCIEIDSITSFNNFKKVCKPSTISSDKKYSVEYEKLTDTAFLEDLFDKVGTENSNSPVIKIQQVSRDSVMEVVTYLFKKGAFTANETRVHSVFTKYFEGHLSEYTIQQYLYQFKR